MKDERRIEQHCILVFEDVEETRDGLERLLRADGYQVALARNEEEAVHQSSFHTPNLMLVGIAGSVHDTIIIACRVRERARLNSEVPIVIFEAEGIKEVEEIQIGQSVYLIKPDNFNQVRRLLKRLLRQMYV